MVAVSESVGLNTRVRMSFRKSKQLSSTSESESTVTWVHLSEDDMCRVLDRDQRTVFAPFDKDTSSRRLGAPSRVTNDGNTSRRVIHHPAESATPTSHSLSSSSSSNLSSNLSSTQISTDGKNVSAVPKVSPNSCKTSSHHRHSTSSSCHQRPSSFASKLVEVLTVSACVLSLVNLPNTTAAPMSSRPPRRLDDETPFWTNPCRIGLSYPDQGGDADYSQLSEISDKELINIITVTSQVAIDHYLTFIDDYVTDTFQKPLAEHLKAWDTWPGYPWLPTGLPKGYLPKKLNQTVPKEFKSKFELENALLDSYEYLQRVAVGMEAVYEDHDSKNTKFQDNFKQSLYELRMVLCEVNTVISSFKIKMRDDIQRSIMPDEIRHLKSDTDRHIRDWLIFREYMNVMEFVLEIFTHISDQMQNEQISS
ncbi:hypothetical protein LSTR_LSTR009015 [Laodelphax striatellus]|uniref:Uncharacterized protein n=1 Tax=Laodelphax striatellus TaxID=195883 RepID=A0A482XD29_LAOST|nr:hypothetical protein LSTR_LSTR009015 [Laodelphax striatellus]